MLDFQQSFENADFLKVSQSRNSPRRREYFKSRIPHLRTRKICLRNFSLHSKHSSTRYLFTIKISKHRLRVRNILQIYKRERYKTVKLFVLDKFFSFQDLLISYQKVTQFVPLI